MAVADTGIEPPVLTMGDADAADLGCVVIAAFGAADHSDVTAGEDAASDLVDEPASEAESIADLVVEPVLDLVADPGLDGESVFVAEPDFVADPGSDCDHEVSVPINQSGATQAILSTTSDSRIRAMDDPRASDV